MDAIAAWFLLPLVLVASSWGIGLLVERLLRTEFADGLVLPVGFAGSLVLLSLPYGFGLPAPAALAFLALPIAAGFVAGRSRVRPSLPRPPLALAALAVYCVYMAPVVLSGSATFAGYAFLGDNAVHFSLVDHVVEHGSRMTDLPYSSYGEVLRINLGNGYPLGPHFHLASLTALLGTEVAWLYQAYVAVPIALAAIPAAALLRSLEVGERTAALGAFTCVLAFLPFAYALQGGVKELIMIMLVLLGAVFAAELAEGGRPLRPAVVLGVTMAAAFTVYSTGGLPWFGAMIAAALALAVLRSPARARTLALAAGLLVAVFALGAAVSFASAITFFEPAQRVLEGSLEGGRGNLISALPFWESFGVWFRGDYRDTSTYRPLAYALIALAAVLAVLGAVHAFRLRALAPLLAVGACLAVWALVPAGIYIEAKLLAILSPVLVLMALAGCTGLARAAGRPAVGAALALVLAGGIVVSDSMAYRDAYLAPKPRLLELEQIGERLAGRGPVMLAEFEEYGKHFLRESGVIAPFDGYALVAAELRNPGRTYATWADLDEMTLDYVQRFPVIVRRRSPVASRPPAPYRRTSVGDYYEVWERSEGAPEVRTHLSLGDDTDPTGPVDCRALGELARQARGQRLLVAERPSPLRLEAADMEHPPDWPVLPGGAVGAARAGELSGELTVPGGRYRIWVKGTFGRGVDVLVDGRAVGRAEQIQSPEQMALAGEVSLRSGPHTVSLVRGGPGLDPGNSRDERYEAVFVEPVAEPRLREVPAVRARALCGRRADWVELAAVG
jgi:hypothetical protein